MNKRLILSFVAILFLVTFVFQVLSRRQRKPPQREPPQVWYQRDYIHCLGCASVDPNNQCEEKPYRCTAKESEYCFSRIVSKNRILLYVERGCISNCIYLQQDNLYRNFTWCCRNRHNCNEKNVWP